MLCSVSFCDKMIVTVIYLCTVLLNIQIDGLHSFNLFKTGGGGRIKSKVCSSSIGNNGIAKPHTTPRSDVNKPDRFIHPQVRVVVVSSSLSLFNYL